MRPEHFLALLPAGRGYGPANGLAARPRTRLAAAGPLLALLVALGLLASACGGSSGGAAAAATTTAIGDVGCASSEQLAFHIHAHLAIFDRGQPVTVPANIGITPRSICWLHTHDTSGIIHIESPVQRTFTLGQFFQVWGAPLDASHLLDQTADEQHQIRAFVNGQERSGPPQDIVLENHQQIVLEYGPPWAEPPPTFTWPAGY